jgi:hypothetical protein
LAATSEIADRLHGKPVQAIDIDDERPQVPCFIMPPTLTSRSNDWRLMER